MGRMIRFFIVLVCLSVAAVKAQNEHKKWYFGNQAALDFNTNPPSILVNSAMNAIEGSASVSDAGGNLLFYTEGTTVYNQSHSIMANGSGLSGTNTPAQSCIILKQPGSSTLYYIFTVGSGANNGGSHYSVVDMSLAAGQGSVTLKNILLSNVPTSEKIAATLHCNGTDMWVVIRDNLLNNINPMFRSYLLTSAGVSTNVVLSVSATTLAPNGYDFGCMKISPNGRKLGCAIFNPQSASANAYEVYDFNNSTGTITNCVGLSVASQSNNNLGAYGCEFSPDGTKFYGTRFGYGHLMFQWNLCAGTSSAIALSKVVIPAIPVYGSIGSMQLGPNGKIYVARNQQTHLGVINDPNASGIACNFVDLGQSLAPKFSTLGLPNFKGYFKTPLPAFSYSNSCLSYTFSVPAILQTYTTINCAASGYSLTGISWNFGDPLSGMANSSGSSQASHLFTGLGIYTVQLVVYYSCGAANDTLTQLINTSNACIAIQQSSASCASAGSATVQVLNGVGPFTYTWLPGAQSASVANGLFPGTYTVLVSDLGNLNFHQAVIQVSPSIPYYASISFTNVSCFGLANGVAKVNGTMGGSGYQYYSWTNGLSTFTTSQVNSLSAGIWTLTLTDSLSWCVFTQTLQIAQPPMLTLQIVCSSPTACCGSPIVLNAIASGGFPGPVQSYSYNWQGGPGTPQYTITEDFSGPYSYTVTVLDSNNCLASQNINVIIVPSPTLQISTTAICPYHTATLTASGATSYTWNPNSQMSGVGNVYTVSPGNTNQQVLIGSSLGCTAIAFSQAEFLSIPSPTLSSNSPVCFGSSLNFSCSGVSSATWSGPGGFSSNIVSPTLMSAGFNSAGVYQVTVTGVNSCTSTAAHTVSVLPLPEASAGASLACEGNSFCLYSNLVPNAFYNWSGPGSFFSLQQNPCITNASTLHTGVYTLTTTDSITSCSSTTVVNVWVNQNPFVQASGGMVCFGKPVVLAANGAFVYQWSGPNGFVGTGQNPAVIANHTSAVVYTVTGFSSQGCSAQDTALVLTRPAPIPTTTVNTIVCAKNSLSLQAGGGVQYYWTGPLNFFTQDKEHVLYIKDVNMGGTYSLTILDVYGCEGYTTVQVHVNDLPTGVIWFEKNSACVPFTSGFKVVPTQPLKTIAANWGDGYIHDLDTLIYKRFEVPGQSELFVELLDSNGCKGMVYTMITAHELPIADFISVPEKPKEFDDPVYFYNKSIGASVIDYFWKTNNHNQDESEQKNTFFTFEEAGLYAVALEVKNIWGCVDTVVKVLEVFPHESVYIPNAFTPNNDGLNDRFLPVLYHAKPFYLMVFSRWGELIYEGNERENGWDGTCRGEKCQDGVYTYKLIVKSEEKMSHESAGVVNLIR